MRKAYIILAVAVIGLLSGCGSPPLVGVSASRPTERPTAHVLPSASPTAQPVVTSALAEPPAPLLSRAPAAPSPTRAAPTAMSRPVAPARETSQQPAGQAAHQIIIDAPQPNTTISSPVAIRGSANFWPFEATLVAVLKDASGNVLGQTPVMVQSPEMGKGGPWSGQLRFAPPATEQEGTLEVYDTSAKDGSILTIARVKVRLGPSASAAAALQIDEPAEGSAVTLPLHVALNGARGDEQLVLRLVLADGKVLAQQVRAELGYVVGTLPGTGASGPATLEVARPDGTVLARRTVRVAAPGETQTVKVAWVVKGGEEVTLQTRRVPRTPQVGAAALNELLWGPNPGEAAYSTSLPAPSEVLHFSGRAAGWGPRVRLLKLTITDGVALANFSRELHAYGGGAARVNMIRKQIEATMFQFPSVKRVVIAIEGQTEGVLQP